VHARPKERGGASQGKGGVRLMSAWPSRRWLGGVGQAISYRRVCRVSRVCARRRVAASQSCVWSSQSTRRTPDGDTRDLTQFAPDIRLGCPRHFILLPGVFFFDALFSFFHFNIPFKNEPSTEPKSEMAKRHAVLRKDRSEVREPRKRRTHDPPPAHVP
jgi:hypothetical protein